MQFEPKKGISRLDYPVMDVGMGVALTRGTSKKNELLEYLASGRLLDIKMTGVVIEAASSKTLKIDLETKNELYRRARCTLFPIQWPEPFGLVMIESLAAGTPVIAFRRGAVPEVIENGRTGFIVDNVDEMVEAVGQIDNIDPGECRRAAKERFGVERFITAHERAYRTLLDEGPSWVTGSLPGPLVV